MVDREFITLIFLMFLNLIITTFFGFTLDILSIQLAVLFLLIVFNIWFFINNVKLPLYLFFTLSLINLIFIFGFTTNPLSGLVIIVNLLAFFMLWKAPYDLLPREDVLVKDDFKREMVYTEDFVPIDRMDEPEEDKIEVNEHYFTFDKLDEVEKKLFPKALRRTTPIRKPKPRKAETKKKATKKKATKRKKKKTKK